MVSLPAIIMSGIIRKPDGISDQKETQLIDNQVIRITVQGLVQGVGFRPFIYLLAKRFQVKGTVSNCNSGVIILATGGDLAAFTEHIVTEAPRAARIKSLRVEPAGPERFAEFRILPSLDHSAAITEICPDIAVCEACLEDMRRQDKRMDYPFVNCTHCGPRFSIVHTLPYDRQKTSMASFPMCPSCRQEYDDIEDRRFHAQPVACRDCGPIISLYEGNQLTSEADEAVRRTARLLSDARILAVKGIGGFHLACDAGNEEVVKALRTRKGRDGKPFAVMFRDLAAAEEYVSLNDDERQSLLSWQRPIVLAAIKKNLAPAVCNGLNRIGAMLPYAPLHHLLFREMDLPALVMTSANLADEPLVADADNAWSALGNVFDALLDHNRDIVNRVDDSVCFIVNGKSRLIRRARGYVPSPVDVDLSVEGILAMGGDIRNAFAIGKDFQAIPGPHTGDLGNAPVTEYFRYNLDRFFEMFRFMPEVIACDAHPAYFSNAMAHAFGLPVIPVQHHHAHLVSCMAEHGLRGETLGVCLDGTGYGKDGKIWGSEFFFVRRDSFKRYGHFQYLMMPGGDVAALEPWRMAVSLLYNIYGKDWPDLIPAFSSRISPEHRFLLTRAMENRINCPESCGAGRYFDAVAALLDICRVNSFEAEAPMRLESLAERAADERYHIDVQTVVKFDPMVRQIISDLRNKLPLPLIASRFHHTMVYAVVEMVKSMHVLSGCKNVVLSGGSFQNAILLENIENQLNNLGFQVYSPLQLPANDGGIALGQMIVAVERRKA